MVSKVNEFDVVVLNLKQILKTVVNSEEVQKLLVDYKTDEENVLYLKPKGELTRNSLVEVYISA